ncbi:hypothetical protein N431DRAFT_123553 [Stipitochalara longipes BDJ]|nr:hypothetical protein N431DRAFT_123553 [Stipitochalara longipes BDJ]
MSCKRDEWDVCTYRRLEKSEHRRPSPARNGRKSLWCSAGFSPCVQTLLSLQAPSLSLPLSQTLLIARVGSMPTLSSFIVFSHGCDLGQDNIDLKIKL